FQAEDGIRDFHVTGVQTCALPISNTAPFSRLTCAWRRRCGTNCATAWLPGAWGCTDGRSRCLLSTSPRSWSRQRDRKERCHDLRSEERRVGKETEYRRQADN